MENADAVVPRITRTGRSGLAGILLAGSVPNYGRSVAISSIAPASVSIPIPIECSSTSNVGV